MCVLSNPCCDDDYDDYDDDDEDDDDVAWKPPQDSELCLLSLPLRSRPPRLLQ